MATLILAAVWPGRVRAGDAQKPDGAPPEIVKIDLNQAVELSLPGGKEELVAQGFHTKDGKAGWVVHIPGGKPIATPAYADGVLFVGGGYGSHEFYALDADSGKVVWKMQTGDDGPTAAVVEDGCVAFNTESCTVIVADARTGKILWQEWLGDPLMSQPAIARGKLFIAYPGANPRGVQHAGGPAPVAPGAPAAPGAVTYQPKAIEVAGVPVNVNVAAGAQPARAGHRLLCADLKTGEHIWEQDLTGDIISAPVIEGEQVLCTCFDGTSFCFNFKDGKPIWKKHNAGTSAPVVADGGQVIVTQKRVDGQKVQEGIGRLDSKNGDNRDKILLAAGGAEYFKEGHDGNVALSPTAQAAQDSSVGFASAPQSAGLAEAGSNVNVRSVVAGWAFQGARAAYANGNILNAQANHFNCLRAFDGGVAWQADATGKGVDGNAQLFAPPALGAHNLYVCSAQGHIVSLRQKDGKLGFAYATGQPMAFQPALARGNVYAGTVNGMLICLKTGDMDADGWTAWGGNAAHSSKITVSATTK